MMTGVLRCALIGAALVLVAGCGVKTAYNNLDRLIAWSVDDFISMDARQEQYFRSELEVLLHWHRTTQLPVYAQGLERIDREVARGLDLEDLLALEEMLSTWGRTLIEAGMPMSAELLYSLDDAQIEALAVAFEKNNDKWLKPYRNLDLGRRRLRWAEEFRDALENFVGRLTPAQRELVARASGSYEPDDAAWLEYRRRWQKDLVALVRARPGYPEFLLSFRSMWLQRERWYGAEYQRIFEANEAMYRRLTLEVLASLEPAQREALSGRLLGIAKDFAELAADAPPTSPAAACLVTC